MFNGHSGRCRDRSLDLSEADRPEGLSLLAVVQEAARAWKDEDYPELVEKGSYQWVREQREAENKRCC